MRVLLVSHSFEEHERGIYTANIPYSLGLAYIAAYLKMKGHTVDILWLDSFEPSYSHRCILDKIEKLKPDVLGIQMFTLNRVASYRLIEDCAKDYPRLRIVVGGIHASSLYNQIIKKYRHIIIVRGEGEIVLAELLSAFENERPLDAIKGIVYCKNNEIVMTEDRELNYDLDSLPFPAHEVFFDSEPRRTTAHMITTRGCPFQCSFCCLHVISKRRYRKRNVDNVIKEIVDLKTKYPRLKRIQFHDDAFTLDNDRVIDFCKKIISLNLDIKFIASTRVKPVSEEMFYYMRKAGFEKLMFGLETGAEKLMESIHKRITKKDAENLFYKSRRFNFVVTTFLMLGFPGENERTVSETIAFVKKLQKIKYSYIAGVGKVLVYPETEVYQVMKSKNCISDDYWLSDKPTPYFTAELDLKALNKFEERMLNHLALSRIFTLKGFMCHFLSMPLVIILFLFKNIKSKDLIKGLIAAVIKMYSPWIYLKLHRFRYRNNEGVAVE